MNKPMDIIVAHLFRGHDCRVLSSQPRDLKVNLGVALTKVLATTSVHQRKQYIIISFSSPLSLWHPHPVGALFAVTLLGGGRCGTPRIPLVNEKSSNQIKFITTLYPCKIQASSPQQGLTPRQALLWGRWIQVIYIKYITACIIYQCTVMMHALRIQYVYRIDICLNTKYKLIIKIYNVVFLKSTPLSATVVFEHQDLQIFSLKLNNNE